MPLENRNLEPGVRLVARYKKEEYRAEVVAGEGDKTLIRLEDGREFTSVSAAGSAVMGGVACNGWRFWSLEGAEGAKPKAPKQAKSKAKGKKDGEAEERVACGTCGEEFPSAAEAAEHVAQEHPVAEEQAG